MFSVPEGRAANHPLAVTTFRPPIAAPLPGAFVSATPLTVSLTPGRLRAGALYSMSDRDGSYALVLPVEIGTVGQIGGFPGYVLKASHPAHAQPVVQSVALNSLLAAFEFGIFERNFAFPAALSRNCCSGSRGFCQPLPSMNAGHIGFRWD